MKRGHVVAVVIPALNEAASIARVIEEIPEWVDRIVVADNGSTDATAEIAASAGAQVVSAPRRGYGSACAAGIRAAKGADVLVFLDADFADYPDRMGMLVDPIVDGRAELVIASRAIGEVETGAMTPAQTFGNWLACALIRRFWRVRFTDLGPFRAIAAPTLARLNMADPDFGWTVEMQIKAARDGVPSLEVPARYRRRIGRSKISGTVRGTLAAGTKILWVIARSALEGRSQRDADRSRRPRAP